MKNHNLFIIIVYLLNPVWNESFHGKLETFFYVQGALSMDAFHSVLTPPFQNPGAPLIKEATPGVKISEFSEFNQI